MRTTAFSLFISALLSLTASAASNEQAPIKLEHPGEVALVDDPLLGWTYRHFPSGLRLYVYDKDSPGKSVCYIGCDTRWPPLYAPADAKPIGDWTPIVRNGGRKQWAYKGRPVYTLVHDQPEKPGGDGVEGVWHLLKP